MKPAADVFHSVLRGIVFKAPKVPYYSDIDSVPMAEPEAIRESLVRQLTQAVQWTRTIQRMSADGFTDFVEVGPGKVLTGLIKKIQPAANAGNAGDAASILQWG